MQPRTEPDVLNGKLSKIRNSTEENRYGLRSDSVSTTVVLQDHINQAKGIIKTLRKQKQQINDKLLELNIKTENMLSDEEVSVLQAEAIL
mgnify:FL=1